MTIILMLLMTLTSLAASPLGATLDKNSDLFFKFPRIHQITQQLKASAVLSTTALNDRGLNISASVSKSTRPDIGAEELAQVGVHRNSQTDLNTSLNLGLRNVGYFNSTQLQLNGAWANSEWQKLNNNIETIDSSKNYSLNLSYDIINGGYKDLRYLENKATERLEFSNLIGLTETLVRYYLDYRYQLLDIYSSYCKLKTSREDLEVMRKALEEIKLSYQLKSTSYKNYLNVMDTFNFVKRNNINYELNYEIFLQRLYFWSNLSIEEWKANFAASVTCPERKEQFSAFFINKPEEKPVYEETILGLRTKASGEAAQFTYLQVKQQIKPSVRPYLEFGQDNSAGYTDKSVAVGVTLNWDTPSVKNKGQVLGAHYNAGAAKIANESNELQFVSQIRTYLITFDKNKELLQLSIDSLENSNSLVKLLEVQKSIGQVDSLSLSNAYTQRNQIRNAIFDSMVNIEKTQQEIYYLKNWKELLVRVGIDLK
jgi:hypothetical protein